MRAPPDISGVQSVGLDDVAAAQALARQKAIATGLVVICALTFVAAKAVEKHHPALPYLAAFAEAAIIGALADWYAVVALFRHPLGLTLPHTAIIPANQARIAEAIGSFIARHFLSGARVGSRVLELDPAASLGCWLAEPHNCKRVAAHAAVLVPDAVEAIDRDLLRAEIERAVLERLAAVDFAEIIAASLEVATRNQRHHTIVDELLERIAARLAEPAALEAIRDRIRAELPTLFRFFLADTYLLQRLVRTTFALLDEVRSDPHHTLRAEFDRLIADFLSKLRTAPEHREKVEILKRELLARPELRGVLADGFDQLIALLHADVAREDGMIRPGFESFLANMAQGLQHDHDLRQRINHWLADAAASLTDRYRHEIALFVAEQVKSWDTQHAVRTIELSLGKDLQYIRINGTLVGGLLGLAIFTGSQLAFR
jgi:uncharacterized membrane-anchored protein YjiN (DUF445 family)